MFAMRVLTIAVVLSVPASAWSQSLSAGEESFKRALEGRIEAVSILSGTAGSSAGLFRWNFSNIDLSISKVNGLGDVGDPTPVGDSGLSWNVVLGGALASFTSHNEFLDTPLEGNKARSTGAVVSFEGGAHFYFPLDLSSRATLGLIYGRMKNEFEVRTSLGQDVSDVGLTNWVVDTLTVAPSIDLAWKPHVGRFTFQPSIRYIYYWIDQVHAVPDTLDASGNSTVWNSQLDVDYLTPYAIATYPIHLGAQVNRFDLRGELRGGMQTGYYYSTELRVLAELHGDLSVVSFLGLCTNYFWSNAFSGRSWAIQVNLKF